MTIEEKKRKIDDYCLSHQCIKCPCYKRYSCSYDSNYNDNINATYKKIFGKEENEMNKEFTKGDLKTGMIVETREGVKYVVLRNACTFGDLIVNGKDLYWNELSNYNDELIEHNDYNELDIVKVYKPKHPYAIHTFEEDKLELIWEREEYKEMTVAEIEKELGYKVKIVKEKENE